MSKTNPARAIIAAFDGIRPAARKIGVPWHNTVTVWGLNGRINQKYRDAIIAAARREGVTLPPKPIFEAAFSKSARA